MNKRIIVIFIPLLLSFFSVHSEDRYYYNMTDGCLEVMNHISSLRLTEARRIIEVEKKRMPGNNIPYWLEDYLDFLDVIIDEELPLYNQFLEARKGRVNRLNHGDESSPWFNYCKADLDLHRGLAGLKFGDYIASVRTISRAYSQFEINRKKFPDFYPSLIQMGFLHVLVGSIPDSYKWVAKLAGFKGTVSGGLSELEEVYAWSIKENDRVFYSSQSLFLLSFIYMNIDAEHKRAIALKQRVIKSNGGSVNLEPFDAYAVGSICFKLSHGDEALKILEGRALGGGRKHIPYLDFMTGSAYLMADSDRAITYLTRYAKNFKGRNFIKAAWQRIGWYYLLRGDTVNYRNAMSNVLSRGYSVVDADKLAEKEAKLKTIPHVGLLKARLLSDGGYYDRALALLKESSFRRTLYTKAHIVEYQYRIARVLDEQDKDDQAIVEYTKVYELASKDPWYYAANSCIKIAAILEERGEKVQASIWYARCLDLDFEEYKNSLSQKAKAGLERTSKTK